MEKTARSGVWLFRGALQGENIFSSRFFGFSLVFVHMESTSLASLHVVYKTWVALVPLLLDTPFGRRSVEASSL